MMKDTALLIMAAGIGSRYGVGIKQLEAVDNYNHIIIDYSIHDAIQAGFKKIVFIIRHEIEDDFKEVIGDRIEAICQKAGVEVGYAFQNMEDVPEGFTVPKGRTKPLGTGQAVLAARGLVDGPFAVINADDYYGKTAFQLLQDWLQEEHGPTEYSLAGFILKNTLSDHGSVTRGICKANEDLYLTDVIETSNIIKTPGGAEANGVAIDPDSHVSMNMWGLMPEFMDLLEEGFVEFFRDTIPGNPSKAEYLLPIYIGQLLREGRVSVKVLETKDAWFGVTYKEDLPLVMESIRELIRDGVYEEDLYADL